MKNKRESIGGAIIVPKKTEDLLNQRQLVDYKDFRTRLIKWMRNIGKDPEKADGYAKETVRQRSYNLDKFFRWTWEQEDGYTLNVTTDHADSYSKELAYRDVSMTYKANSQKAIKTLFKFRRFENGEDVEWEPEIKFNNNSGTHNPRDFLTREERRKIKEAVLEYGSIPAYHAVTPDERDRWKGYLAQRFEKPKDEVSKEDWKRANGWKYPSMVWVSMDAGLRPVEVGRARRHWLDLENNMLRIPKEQSSKNVGNWDVGLSSRTSNILRRWIAERKHYDKYRDSEKVWLTRYGNPYGSNSLNKLLRKLCEEARIVTKNRDISWYSIRHSVGTYMAQDAGLAATQAQLRHRSEKTTMRYDQAPVEDRKKVLNQWD